MRRDELDHNPNLEIWFSASYAQRLLRMQAFLHP